jgi:VanZ family protein
MFTSPRMRNLAGIAFLITAGVVLFYTLRPGESGIMFLWRDKFQHMAAYSALSFLAGLYARSWRQAAMFAVGLVAVGYGLEIAQTFVGRSYDLLDAAANAAGCLIGFTLSRILARF